MSNEPTAAAVAFSRLRAAMAMEGLTTAEKAVLLVLTIMADAAGLSWPSATTIARNASVGRRTVFEALVRLEALGMVRREQSAGKSTRYRIDPCAGRTSAPSALVREPHPTSAPAAPEQPGTPKLKKKASPSPSGKGALFAALAAGIDLPALPASATAEQWTDFAAMRVELTRAKPPRPWTFGAAKKARETLIALAAAGHDAGRSLDASVLNGWQGLFKPKDDQDGQRAFRAGSGGAARVGRGRPLDGFTAALRHVTTRGGANDTGGG